MDIFERVLRNFGRFSGLKGRKEFEMNKKSTCLCADSVTQLQPCRPDSAHPASDRKINAPTDDKSGPAFFGAAPRAPHSDGQSARKIDAQEFWRRLDP